jgi:hypothetical protein
MRATILVGQTLCDSQESQPVSGKSGNPFRCPMVNLCVPLVPGTLDIPCLHPYNRMQALQLRPPSTVQPLTLIWNLFHALFQRGPDTVFYIHVRVSRGEFDQCVACVSSGSALPDIPFTAVIQASRVLCLAKLQSFLPGAEWTPVGARLCSDQRYQNEFVSRDEGVYHYFNLREPPALGKGGRGRRKSTAPAVKFAHFSLQNIPS